MAVFVRCKRVTDPLDDRVKASICGCCSNNNCYKFDNNFSSSGSEHEAEEHCQSPCLSLLVDEFIQDQDSSSADGFSEADLDASDTDKKGDRFSLSEITKSIKKILNVKTDQYINILSSHVSIATEMSEPIRSSGGNKSMVMRKIVAVLRELGHNAGICKTRWEKTGSVTAGGYEFIDVVVGGNSQRYFVDIDFVGEFEIVRHTSEYNSLLKVLPKVYICGREELKEIVKLMCYASKKSLKSRDLHLPPWRKNQFMQLKWFGPNRRTVNPVPSSNGSVSVSTPVRCRSVGFDAVSDGKGRFVVPAATRT